MRAKISALLVVAVLGLAAMGLLIWRGLPVLFRGAVRMVPVAWEERLGESVAQAMGRASLDCDNPALREAVEEMQTRLGGAMEKHPYRFRVRVVRNPEVNAFAAPGGYIVLYSGLVERMETPEELAGVLAHEMQHVVQRHSTQAIARAVGLQLFFALVLGDPGGLTGLAGNLGLLHFMRSDERSADEAGMAAMMRAGIDPQGMVEGFRKLRAEGGDNGAAFAYLSTHPPLEERIQYLQEQARRWRGPGRPLRAGLKLTCAAAR